MFIGYFLLPDRFAAAFSCANRLSCRVVDVDPEYALQALRPSHRSAAFGWHRFLRIRCRGMPASPAPLGRRHPRAVLAVGREQAVKTGQIYPRFRHQRCQPGDEIQWFEDDVRRAVSVRRLQLIANIPVRRERQALLRDGRPADVATQPLELLALIRPRRPASKSSPAR